VISRKYPVFGRGLPWPDSLMAVARAFGTIDALAGHLSIPVDRIIEMIKTERVPQGQFRTRFRERLGWGDRELHREGWVEGTGNARPPELVAAIKAFGECMIHWASELHDCAIRNSHDYAGHEQRVTEYARRAAAGIPLFATSPVSW